MRYAWCIIVALLISGCSQGERLPDVVAVPQEEISAEQARNLKTDGHFYLSGVLNADGLAALRARGVETVIDLRLPEQIPADYPDQVRQLGFDYQAYPLRSDGMASEEAQPALEALDAARDWPVLLQCGSGNRVGALYGLHSARRHDLTVSEALERAAAAGMRSKTLSDDLEAILESER